MERRPCRLPFIRVQRFTRKISVENKASPWISCGGTGGGWLSPLVQKDIGYELLRRVHGIGRKIRYPVFLKDLFIYKKVARAFCCRS